MNGANGSSTEELAYLLWERQGRPENTSEQNWMEAEHLARSLAAVTRDEIEAGLRMRGLGPLTQGRELSRNLDGQLIKSDSGTLQLDRSEEDVGGTSVIASCVAGTALLITFGVLISFFRKMG
jgi:hypothetical protein